MQSREADRDGVSECFLSLTSISSRICVCFNQKGWQEAFSGEVALFCRRSLVWVVQLCPCPSPQAPHSPGLGLVSRSRWGEGQEGSRSSSPPSVPTPPYLSEFFKVPLLRIHQRFIRLGMGPSVCLRSQVEVEWGGGAGGEAG